MIGVVAPLQVAAAVLLGSAAAQPFQPGSKLAPLGSLRTSDYDGPYNISLLSTQAVEAEIGTAARGYKGGISDKDIVDFLVNVECLEGQFDTWGVFGQGFIGDLALGGPKPVGAKKANLTDEVRMFLAEVALNEQGHALMTRHAGGMNPCPYIDLNKGFNEIMAKAYNLPEGETIKSKFGAPFDPFASDVNFIVSVLFLEELGATGNKGLIGILTNPVLANAVAGLATSATAQSTIERMVLWPRRKDIVTPMGDDAQTVFAYLSAYRDQYDGPAIHDQGIVNTDPRFIYVPYEGVNMIPTDVRGLTFNRTPQMAINILTLGAKDGKGGFFPKGILGKINTPEGYLKQADGKADWPKCPAVAVEQSAAATGEIMPPITGPGMTVPGEAVLTQPSSGCAIGTGAECRGLQNVPKFKKFQMSGGDVTTQIPANDGKLAMEYSTCGKCSASQVKISPAAEMSGSSKGGKKMSMKGKKKYVKHKGKKHEKEDKKGKKHEEKDNKGKKHD